MTQPHCLGSRSSRASYKPHFHPEIGAPGVLPILALKLLQVVILSKTSLAARLALSVVTKRQSCLSCSAWAGISEAQEANSSEDKSFLMEALLTLSILCAALASL